MLTDVRPIVERIVRQLVLAGLPVVAACISGGRTSLDDFRDAGASRSGGGAGTLASGGSGSGGAITATGGSGDSGGAGARGTGGGHAGGTGGQVACLPAHVLCGAPGACPGPLIGPLPVTKGVFAFDANDPRWASLYRACAATGAPGCAPDCAAFCAAVADAKTFRMDSFMECEVACDTPDTITIGTVTWVCGRRCAATGRQRSTCTPFTGAHAVASSLGDHLARAAELEAESVPAFARLVRGLVAHGAPPSLVGAARSALREEARHWRQTRALALRHGGQPVKPHITPAPFPSLEALALENVVEGCVRETFGAMVASHQAAAAQDTGVRHLMTRIAADELGHASLSWRIDAWAADVLGPAFHRPRRQAARRAVRELQVEAQAASAVTPAFASAAGLPGAPATQALLAAAWSHVWEPTFGLRRSIEPTARVLARE